MTNGNFPIVTNAHMRGYDHVYYFLRHLNEFNSSYEHIYTEARFFPDGKISGHETWMLNVRDADSRSILHVFIRTV